MAQNTVLSAQTAAGTSSDIVVAAGATVTVGLYATNGLNISGPVAEIWQDTPGADIPVATLTADRKSCVISGPGTFRVKKIKTATAIGVFTET